MKKNRKLLAIIVTVAMLLSVVTPAFAFPDSAASPHAQAINTMSDLGVFQGFEDGTFRPNDSMTRAQAAKIMAYLEGEGQNIAEDPTIPTVFPDVEGSLGQWAAGYINYCTDAGIIEGHDTGLFGPDENVTQRQLMAMLLRVLGYDDLSGDRILWDDIDAEAQALGLVSWAYSANLAASRAVLAQASYNATFVVPDVYGNYISEYVFGMAPDIPVAPSDVVSVTAVSNTVVEVEFKAAQARALREDFTIEGLDVINATLKPGQPSFARLTTSSQEEGVTYRLYFKGEFTGKSFTGLGVSDVIPNSIHLVIPKMIGDVTENEPNTQIDGFKSNAKKFGEMYRIEAYVLTGEEDNKANIEVNFDIDSMGGMNPDMSLTATTNEDGYAWVEYTRNHAGTDFVTATVTGAPASVRDVTRVFWGIRDILEVKITDVAGNEIEPNEDGTIEVINGTTLHYKLTLRDPRSGSFILNEPINVTFHENLDDFDGTTANNTSARVADPRLGNQRTPFQNKDHEEAFDVRTTVEGNAVFTLTGSNTAATPVVFIDADTARYRELNIQGDNDRRWSPVELASSTRELQVVTPKVVFRGLQAPYTFEFDAGRAGQSDEYFASGPNHNRLYQFTVRDEHGEPYRNGRVQVAFWENVDGDNNTRTDAYFVQNAGGARLATQYLRGFANEFTGDGPRPGRIAGVGIFLRELEPTRAAPVLDDYQQAVVQLDNNGRGFFRVAAPTGTVNMTATPIVWIDVDAAGGRDINHRLESGEPREKAGRTIFQLEHATAPHANLAFNNAGQTVGETQGVPTFIYVAQAQNPANQNQGDVMEFRYELRNQSNVISNTAGFNRVNFTIRNVTGETYTIRPRLVAYDQTANPGVPVVNPAGTPAIFQDTTQTFGAGLPRTWNNGDAITLDAGTSVTISAAVRRAGDVAGTTSTINRVIMEVEVPGSAVDGVASGTIGVSASGASINRNVGGDPRNIKYVSNSEIPGNFIRVNTAASQLPTDSFRGRIIGFTFRDLGAGVPRDATGFHSVDEPNNFGRIILLLDGTMNQRVAIPYTADDNYFVGLDGSFTNPANFNQFTGPARFNMFENRLSIGNRLFVDNYNTAAGVATDFYLANINDTNNPNQRSGNVVAPAPAVPVTGVTMNQAALPLNVGDTGQLTANIAPANASNQTVNWSSSDATVATVDANGLVTAVAAGTATITATTADGGFTDTCTVTVTAPGAVGSADADVRFGALNFTGVTVTASDVAGAAKFSVSPSTRVEDLGTEILFVYASPIDVTIYAADGTTVLATASVALPAYAQGTTENITINF